ncbi:MarR family winged helix-turn-helix transcriptional regulator [Parathalassolituus penaei]|uniref:MarR family transcriptional regulator n=1 Tax=Parathalassolituus penaei TaxID=2997323 RepID=A0A9X3EK10_9GAMM|nr:MarR family transcriptional regulator [Parathalassolituus penaei]MCY0964033.1 MarR family transcriptional regulator [Parathalassolituus penaei]
MSAEDENRQRLTQALDLNRYVPAQITLLSNKLSAGASACYRKHFGVGIVEWRLLSLLAIETPLSAHRMCQSIGLDKSAVSRALRSMENQGYIQSNPDPDDARRVTIHMMPTGQAIHDRILQVAIKREELLLADFSDSELETLLQLLQKMNNRVETVNSYYPKQT